MAEKGELQFGSFVEVSFSFFFLAIPPYDDKVFGFRATNFVTRGIALIKIYLHIKTICLPPFPSKSLYKV